MRSRAGPAPTHDPAADTGARAGLERDGRLGPVLVAAAVHAATNSLLAGQLYCELGAKLGVTVDGLYKSGRADSGRFVRAVGTGFYVDGPRWLAKAYYDPYVNFSDVDMFRLAVGAKF